MADGAAECGGEVFCAWSPSSLPETQPLPPPLSLRLSNFLFPFLICFIAVRLIASIVLISAVQQNDVSVNVYILFFFCLFAFFLGLLPRHMEVPMVGVSSELQLLAYTRATATPDPSHVFDLHHSSTLDP